MNYDGRLYRNPKRVGVHQIVDDMYNVNKVELPDMDVIIAMQKMLLKGWGINVDCLSAFDKPEQMPRDMKTCSEFLYDSETHYEEDCDSHMTIFDQVENLNEVDFKSAMTNYFYWNGYD